jgi:hypothetical protein
LHSADEREYFTTVGNTICGGSVVFRAEAFPTRACFPEDALSMADWVMFNHLLDVYPPTALAIIRQPTLLHFTAGRKRERHSGFELLQGYLAVADRVSWWPEPLRPTIPDGLSPQAVFAERLSESGGVTAIRDATLEMINRIALDNLAPRASTSARSELSFEKLERQNVLLRAQVSALRASTSWRLTRPLRMLASALARLLARPSPNQRSKD